MAAIDNLEQAIKDGKVVYDSLHVRDKVVHTGSVEITNPGGSGSNDDQIANITTASTSNPYGKKCLVRYRWSIDGTNYNYALAHLYFSYTINFSFVPTTSPPIVGLRAAVSVGTSDSTIYFRTANGYHGNATQAGVSDPVTYTPTSQTFYIDYVLYEEE